MALPDWAGAAVVYERCRVITMSLNVAAYASQRHAWKRKTGFRFSPSAEAESIIDAMDRGDEEALKAVTWTYRNIWQESK